MAWVGSLEEVRRLESVTWIDQFGQKPRPSSPHTTYALLPSFVSVVVAIVVVEEE